MVGEMDEKSKYSKRELAQSKFVEQHYRKTNPKAYGICIVADTTHGSEKEVYHVGASFPGVKNTDHAIYRVFPINESDSKKMRLQKNVGVKEENWIDVL